MQAVALSVLARAMLESTRETGGLTNSATFQAQFYSFELTSPNIYFISDLLESMKGWLLQTESCRTFLTQYPKGVPVRIPY